MTSRLCVGVDGCKGGWVAVAGAAPQLRVYRTFEDILADWPDAQIAVDMPIGLPERISGGGRSPEKLVRPMLGPRQSSVFAMPARTVVEMGGRMTGRTGDDYPLHREASALARTLSDPPKGVSIQGFYLFPKILEIDALLRANGTFRDRVKESHPEVAFTVLNGGDAMRLPKKIKGRVNASGMEERRSLLARHGLTAPFLTDPPPPGVGADDVLDAAVCWLVAGRVARGEAVSFPDPPERDAHGLEIAIWA
jgi:predicted RNase H-like nuclease